MFYHSYLSVQNLTSLVCLHNISWHYLPLEAVHLCSEVLLLQNQTQQEVESGVSGAESDSWCIVDSSLFQAVKRRLPILILQHVPCGNVKNEHCGIQYAHSRQQAQKVFAYICKKMCINIELKKQYFNKVTHFILLICTTGSTRFRFRFS